MKKHTVNNTPRKEMTITEMSYSFHNYLIHHSTLRGEGMAAAVKAHDE